jgi:hypothetical protein
MELQYALQITQFEQKQKFFSAELFWRNFIEIDLNLSNTTRNSPSIIYDILEEE